MAIDPVTPRGGAANVSRRELLGAAATTPFLSARSIVPNPTAWEAALKVYAAAHYRHAAYYAGTLRPAYDRYNADMAQSTIPPRPEREPIIWTEIRERIVAFDRAVIDAGGDRAAMVRARIENLALSDARATVAHELRLRRERGRLNRRHHVLELEEVENDLQSVKLDALRDLLATPALDHAGLLTKIRSGYEEIFRHEDDDDLLLAVFADVERLCG